MKTDATRRLWIYLDEPGDRHPHLWCAELVDEVTGRTVCVVVGETGHETLTAARVIKDELARKA